MNHVETYYAVYANGRKLPIALFLAETEADKFRKLEVDYLPPCRRIIAISPSTRTPPNTESEAIRILREITLGPDEGIGCALEQARRILK
jgi:hypothetical protein